MTTTDRTKSGSSELFAGLLNEAGLEFGNASELLTVPTKTIMLWFSGTESPSADAVRSLCEFIKLQNKMAEQICQRWEKEGRPDRLRYPVSTCNRSAQRLGWPSRDTQVVAVTKAQVMLAPVLIEIVPAPPPKHPAKDTSSEQGA